MEADKEGREGLSEKRQDEKELDAKQEAEVQNEDRKGDDVKEMNILDRLAGRFVVQLTGFQFNVERYFGGEKAIPHS